MDKTKLRRILASEGLIPKTAMLRADEIKRVEKEGWPDMVTQNNASKKALDVIWKQHRKRGLSGTPSELIDKEIERIRSRNLNYDKYLRDRGSEFSLDRMMRSAIYLQYLAKNQSVKSETWRRLANQQVAQTILRQMGGTGRLSAMINAKDFVSYSAAADSRYGEGLGGVAFKFSNPGRGKPNFIKIILNERDYYDVELGRVRGLNFKVLKKIEDLPASNLKSFFEGQTGLYLSL